jgi:hypothetical protein
MSQPTASLSIISNSSTMGPPPQPAHTIGNTPVPVKFQHNTLVIASMKTTDTSRSAWGPTLFLTLLCHGLRYLKPLREQNLRPAVISHHCTMHTNSSPPAPNKPFCTFLPTRTKCTIGYHTQATPTTNHNCLGKLGLQMWRLQEGHTPMKLSSHVHRRTGFSPREPQTAEAC